MRAQSGVVLRERLAEAPELTRRHVLDGTCRPVWTDNRRAVKLLGHLYELIHVLVGATNHTAGPFPGHAQCCKTMFLVLADFSRCAMPKCEKLKICATSWTWIWAALGFRSLGGSNGANRMCQLCHALPNVRCVAWPALLCCRLGGSRDLAVDLSVRELRRRGWCPPTTLCTGAADPLWHRGDAARSSSLVSAHPTVCTWSALRLWPSNSTNVNKLQGFSTCGAVMGPEAEDFGAPNWAKYFRNFWVRIQDQSTALPSHDGDCGQDHREIVTF